MGQSLDIPVPNFHNYALGPGSEGILKIVPLSDGVRITGVAPGEAVVHVFDRAQRAKQYRVRVRERSAAPTLATPPPVGEAGPDTMPPAATTVVAEPVSAAPGNTPPTVGVQSPNPSPAEAAALAVAAPRRPSTRRLTAAEREAKAENLKRVIGRPGVEVEVGTGTVTLTGTVDSELDRERAGRLAELLGTSKVVNNLQVVPPKPAEPGPLPGVGETGGLTPQLTEELTTLAAASGEEPLLLSIEPGRSRILTTTENIMKIIVADGQVVSAEAISARQALFIGQNAGKTDAYLLVEQYPDDPLGVIRHYVVEVAAPVVETPAPDPSTLPLTAGEIQLRLEDLLVEYPLVTVQVLRARQSAEPTVILRGEVPTEADVQRVGDIAAVFGGSVLNHVTVTPPPEIPEEELDVVQLRKDLSAEITAMLRERLGMDTVTAEVTGKGVVLTGTVPHERYLEKAEQYVDAFADWERIKLAVTDAGLGGAVESEGDDAMRIVNPALDGYEEYVASRRAPTGGRGGTSGSSGGVKGVINLLEVVGAVEQVMTEAKIVEIDRNALLKMGVEWGTADTQATTTSGGVPTAKVGTVAFGEKGGVGQPITRLSSLVSTLEVLEDTGKAHTLATPNLLAVEGTRADLVVGGEVPIPRSTGTTGGAGGTAGGFVTQSYEFRPFGIILSVLPEATEGGHIVMQLRVEVSQIDYANGVTTPQGTIPAFSVRTATNSVAVLNGETIVIGGLLSQEDQEQIQRIPFLSDLPILGELFKKRTFKTGETELVIFLTPHVVAQAASAETLLRAGELRDEDVLEAPTVETSFGGVGGGGGAGGGGGGGGY